ncbi:MAG: RNA polymerase sigma factor [Actinobacteria bacterium]|nr:MAG: RNA polymerase sigma factor [Actinomycetota bacterium]
MSPTLSGALLRAQSDQRLCALAAEGHRHAFELLVERYRRPLERYVGRFVPSGRREDILQQTFLNAWTALRRGAQIREWKPWIYRLAHNSAVDALRAEAMILEELPEEITDRAPAAMSASAADGGLSARLVATEALATLAALPDGQREALVRTAVHGESYADVAHGLGVSNGAVRQLIHRARLTVRAAITAITPAPVAAWASRRQMTGQVVHRLAEGAAARGGAGAGAGAVFLKGGGAILIGGVIAAGPILAPGGARRPIAGKGGPSSQQALGAIPGASSLAGAGTVGVAGSAGLVVAKGDRRAGHGEAGGKGPGRRLSLGQRLTELPAGRRPGASDFHGGNAVRPGGGGAGPRPDTHSGDGHGSSGGGGGVSEPGGSDHGGASGATSGSSGTSGGGGPDTGSGGGSTSVSGSGSGDHGGLVSTSGGGSTSGSSSDGGGSLSSSGSGSTSDSSTDLSGSRTSTTESSGH